MSSGDAFEAGEPPAKSRQDGLEPGPPPARPRMSEAGDDDLGDEDLRRPIGKQRRSGAVTAVGVIAIVLGCFVLMGAICMPLTPMFMKSTVDFVEKANPNDPNLPKLKQAVADLPVLYFYVMAGVEFLRAVGLVGGGIGVVRRLNAARLLVIALAVVGVLLVLVGVVAGIAMNTIKFDDPGSMIGGICGTAFSIILNVGFAIMALFVLLNRKNAAEFRS